MAGINNFNLGNNLKLQQTQQLKATVEVDTQKSEGKEVGDAKPSAVWTSRFQLQKGWNDMGSNIYHDGDVIMSPGRNGKLEYYRVMALGEGDKVLLCKISYNEISDYDYEEYRGDINK